MSSSPGIPRDARISNRPDSYVGQLTDFLNQSSVNIATEEEREVADNNQSPLHEKPKTQLHGSSPVSPGTETFGFKRTSSDAASLARSSANESSRTRSFIAKFRDRGSFRDSFRSRKSSPRTPSFDAYSPSISVPSSFAGSRGSSDPDTPRSGTQQRQDSNRSSHQSNSTKLSVSPTEVSSSPDKSSLNINRSSSGKRKGFSVFRSGPFGKQPKQIEDGLFKTKSYSPLASKSSPMLALNIGHGPFDVDLTKLETQKRLHTCQTKYTTNTPPEIQSWTAGLLDRERTSTPAAATEALGIDFEDLSPPSSSQSSSDAAAARESPRLSKDNTGKGNDRQSYIPGAHWSRIVNDVLTGPSRQDSVKTARRVVTEPSQTRIAGRRPLSRAKSFESHKSFIPDDDGAYTQQRAATVRSKVQKRPFQNAEGQPGRPLSTRSASEDVPKAHQEANYQMRPKVTAAKTTFSYSKLPSPYPVKSRLAKPLPSPSASRDSHSLHNAFVRGGQYDVNAPSPLQSISELVRAPSGLKIKNNPAKSYGGLSVDRPGDHQYIKSLLSDYGPQPPSIILSPAQEMSSKRKGKARADTSSYFDCGSSPGDVKVLGRKVMWNASSGTIEYLNNDGDVCEVNEIHSTHPAFRDTSSTHHKTSRPQSTLSITDVMNDWIAVKPSISPALAPTLKPIPSRHATGTPDSQETVKPYSPHVTPDDEIAAAAVDDMMALEARQSTEETPLSAPQTGFTPVTSDAKSHFSKSSSEDESPKRSRFAARLASGLTSTSVPNLKRFLSSDTRATEVVDNAHFGLLTGDEMQHNRVHFGVGAIVPQPNNADTTAHPYHPFVWGTKKLFCKSHEGQCTLCKEPCCMLKIVETLLGRGHGARMAGGEAGATKMLDELRGLGRKYGGGIEVFRRFVKCTWCEDWFCPGCASKCGEHLCQDVSCTMCISDPWGCCVKHEAREPRQRRAF